MDGATKPPQRYNVSATLTVSDSGNKVQAGSYDEALAKAQDLFGTPDAWTFHVADGRVEIQVSESL